MFKICVKHQRCRHNFSALLWRMSGQCHSPNVPVNAHECCDSDWNQITTYHLSKCWQIFWTLHEKWVTWKELLCVVVLLIFLFCSNMPPCPFSDRIEIGSSREATARLKTIITKRLNFDTWVSPRKTSQTVGPAISDCSSKKSWSITSLHYSSS